MNKEGRWVEGSVHHHNRGIVWTNHDVFQINELTSNFADYDKWNPIGPY